MFAEFIVETAFRQTQVQRLLATFKSRTFHPAATGFLTFLAFAGCFAQAGTKTAAYTDASFLEPAAGANSCKYICRPPYYALTSSTLTICSTLWIIPRRAGQSSFTTLVRILVRPRALTVARWSLGYPIKLRVSVILPVPSCYLLSPTVLQQFCRAEQQRLWHSSGISALPG